MLGIFYVMCVCERKLVCKLQRECTLRARTRDYARGRFAHRRVHTHVWVSAASIAYAYVYRIPAPIVLRKQRKRSITVLGVYTAVFSLRRRLCALLPTKRAATDAESMIAAPFATHGLTLCPRLLNCCLKAPIESSARRSSCVRDTGRFH